MGGGNIASQTEDEFGIIPRAISDMFEIIKVSIFALFLGIQIYVFIKTNDKLLGVFNKVL